MSCQKNNITGNSWEVLKNLPAFRYFKEPVDTVAQLYEKYPDGAERMVLVYVSEHNWFYTFKITNRTWIPVGINDSVVNEIISDVIQNEAEVRESADSSLQQFIRNEVENRKSADRSLRQFIKNEAEARGNADSSLQQLIENEAEARESADTAILEAIENGTGGGIEDAPQDGKLYARKDGGWVEANDKRIVILSEEEYEDLSSKDEDTLYFII
jgi:hypothetical protein